MAALCHRRRGRYPASPWRTSEASSPSSSTVVEPDLRASKNPASFASRSRPAASTSSERRTRHERHAVDVGHDPVPRRHQDPADPHRDARRYPACPWSRRSGRWSPRTRGTRAPRGRRRRAPRRRGSSRPSRRPRPRSSAPRPNSLGRPPGRHRRRGRSHAVPWSPPRARPGCPPACSRRGRPGRPPQRRTRPDGACGRAASPPDSPMVAEPSRASSAATSPGVHARIAHGVLLLVRVGWVPVPSSTGRGLRPMLYTPPAWPTTC